MTEIIPAVIPQNLNVVREKFSVVKGLTRKVAIDIVDGKYAPTVTWPFNEGQTEELLKIVRGEERFPYVDDFVLQADMLVLHPIEYIPNLLSIGVKSFVVHIDSTDNVQECIDAIKKAKLEVGLGIKPSGDVKLLESFLLQIDFVQFMGNDRVGYNGVELDPIVYEKISDFHKDHPEMPIQIDIGVNFNTAPQLILSGASRLISGSAIWNTPSIPDAIQKLQTV